MSSGGASNLVQSTKELCQRWQQTQVHWRDGKSAEFEHQFLEMLPTHVARASTVIEEIEALLAKVRSDCE